MMFILCSDGCTLMIMLLRNQVRAVTGTFCRDVNPFKIQQRKETMER